MTEYLCIASLLAYAYAAIAFVGGLFPDYAIAAVIGVLCTAGALIAHFIGQRRAEAASGHPAHCEPREAQR